ncbi:MAG: phosphoenolpyruvate carboxylase [Flavobacteriales bacterium]|jgi:phosphoenolpyruvate carboxylase
MQSSTEAFKELVALRYQIYNSLFLTLNLDGVNQTGIWLPHLNELCEKGFEEKKNPKEIIDQFFNTNKPTTNEKDRIDQMFQFIQYIERQVVLVDALEDSAFTEVNDVQGAGSYGSLFQRASNQNALHKLKEALKAFRVRIVLTAHPTQFYPGAVLGIISDLDEAIRGNNLRNIERYLEQLGKTPFFKKEKPSPLDEAISLVWYLENIFYHSIPQIYEEVAHSLGDEAEEIIGSNPLLQLGFWPGGDRDGNPFVNTEITLKVADRLRTSLFKCYFKDIRILKRRITFRGTERLMQEIHDKLYTEAFGTTEQPDFTPKVLLQNLTDLEGVLIEQHNGLFAEDVRSLIHKVKIFGFHFSTMDIRQDSRVIKQTMVEIRRLYPDLFPSNYDALSQKERIDVLFNLEGDIDPSRIEDPVLRDTAESYRTIRKIKAKNGGYGAYRYIISNCRGVEDMANVHAIARLSNWKSKLSLDIIPLFETIDDLAEGGATMTELYSHPIYAEHLALQGMKQVVMLGFSDGTKDGGYLSANWGIYKAKEAITGVSRKNQVSVTFFDGRGGPPARGGGNTHKFYASLGNDIESNRIQLTIQGQTISSNFGTVDSSKFNLEQLMSAGLENSVLDDLDKRIDAKSRALIEELSEISYSTYCDFKAHKCFVPYLEKMSTLKYYGLTNIGSRPSKRGKSDELKFEDLRAIPFVGAWSQLKQNVPGFFGLGTAFETIDKEGRMDELQALYQGSLFFRTLVENSMQSLSKSYFPLTAYMKDDPEFGEFWTWIFEESQRARKYLKLVSGQKMLLETNEAGRLSIKLRERIVLPLLTIQQYALIKIKELEHSGDGDSAAANAYRKLVVRSLYGNINAGRNSA